MPAAPARACPQPGATDDICVSAPLSPECESETHEGPLVAVPAMLGVVHFETQPDPLERIRPTKDNGARADLLDENCEAADVFGSPFNAFTEPSGATEASSGGLTDDCKDAVITIRMLEGDLDLDCDVDSQDDQMAAFLYGQAFGSLADDPFFDVEPATFPPDWDVDTKDVQFIYGRNGSTCESPIPDQNPQPAVPDP